MSETAQLTEWLGQALPIAQRAGQVLLEHQHRVCAEHKGRRDLVTEADRTAERVVVTALQEIFPEHAVLAEEGVLTPQGRADRDADYVWLVDPLDGTTNYVHGIPFFCVALGLQHRGEMVLGVVHAPVFAETYTAVRGGGANRNGEPIRVSSTSGIENALLATGFSYHRNEPGVEDNSARLARVLPRCRDLRRLGSAQLDLCLTAAGTFDGYWEMHLGPYDVAAGGVIVREAGGMVTDLGGGDEWVREGHVLASNGVLHAALTEVVGGAPIRA